MKKIIFLIIVGLLLTACGDVTLGAKPTPTAVPAPRQEPTAPPTATTAPTTAPTNTPAPTATTAPVKDTPAPISPAPAASTMLKYDETNGVSLPKGQTKLIALYLRDAMAVEGTQAAMESAIGSIQKEAASVGAETGHGKSFTPDRAHAWLVWHSNVNQVTTVPTDVSDVMGTHRTGSGKIWVVVPFAAGVPLPTKNTFSASEGEFWWVAVR